MSKIPPKVATAFHESFYMMRPRLAQLLKIAIETENRGSGQAILNFDSIHDQTSLGTNQVKAMRRYAYGAGLLDVQEVPTPFGRAVYKCDPGFSEVATQWLLHYHMAAPHRSGPGFWGHLTRSALRPGNELSLNSIENEINDYLTNSTGQSLAARTLNTTASVFLATYHKPDALSGLGILQAAGDKKFLVNEPEPPGMNVFAYVLADYWNGVWEGRNGINLNELSEVGGPASLLLLGSGETNFFLSEMQQAGLVEVQRKVPPYMAVRLWNNADQLLERLYD